MTLIVIAIVIAILLGGKYFLDKVRENKIIDLDDIEPQDNEEILQLLNLGAIREEIDIRQLEIPKIHNNIFYKINFIVHSTDDVIQENIDKIQSDTMHLSFEKTSLLEYAIEYSCILSDYNNKGIELLERISYKYDPKTIKRSRKLAR